MLATKDVMEETLSVRCSAAQYYIPPSPMHDYISRHNCKGSQRNISKVVTKKQNQGFGITAPISLESGKNFRNDMKSSL